MCEECLHSPCLHGCPNEKEPTAVYVCHDCNDEIYEGDTYLKFDHYILCESYVESYSFTAEL